ncbi:hypothetical protein ADK96_27175 [Streptomyces sp. IGB124]|nr:hypothetical protein ADK96_27175 [Streptomyces sp. IGB124]
MAPGEAVIAENAQRQPVWLRRSFFTQRRVMLDFLPDARVMGEAPAYAQAAGVGEPLPVVSDLGEDPGSELSAEAGEAEDDSSVRVLREGFFDRLGQVVGGGARGLQLNQKVQHLPAKRVLDQRRLVGPLGSEDLTQPLGLCWDAPLTTSPLERGLQLRAREASGLGWRRGQLEELVGLGPAEPVLPGFDGRESGRVVLAQQGSELVGDLLAGSPTRETDFLAADSPAADVAGPVTLGQSGPSGRIAHADACDFSED